MSSLSIYKFSTLVPVLVVNTLLASCSTTPASSPKVSAASTNNSSAHSTQVQTTPPQAQRSEVVRKYDLMLSISPENRTVSDRPFSVAAGLEDYLFFDRGRIQWTRCPLSTTILSPAIYPSRNKFRDRVCANAQWTHDSFYGTWRLEYPKFDFLEAVSMVRALGPEWRLPTFEEAEALRNRVTDASRRRNNLPCDAIQAFNINIFPGHAFWVLGNDFYLSKNDPEFNQATLHSFDTCERNQQQYWYIHERGAVIAVRSEVPNAKWLNFLANLDRLGPQNLRNASLAAKRENDAKISAAIAQGKQNLRRMFAELSASAQSREQTNSALAASWVVVRTLAKSVRPHWSNGAVEVRCTEGRGKGKVEIIDLRDSNTWTPAGSLIRYQTQSDAAKAICDSP